MADKNEVSTCELKGWKKSTDTEWYRREFEKWLNDCKNTDKKIYDHWLNKFKKTNGCDDAEEFEARCIEEHHRVFREFVWIPMIRELIEQEGEILFEIY